jgi:hypothetical protein
MRCALRAIWEYDSGSSGIPEVSHLISATGIRSGKSLEGPKNGECIFLKHFPFP